MALTQVDSGLIESGAALENIGAGNITPAYLNTQAQYTGFKNRIINGAMGIWQRGTSFTNTANTSQYTADRWSVFSGVGLPAATTQVSSGLQDFPNALRVQRPNGNTATTNYVALQVIETANCRDLSGQSITVSFWARAGANYSQSGNALPVFIGTGTGTDQGSSSWINGTWTGAANTSQNVTLTTTMTQYSLTYSIPVGTNEIVLAFVVYPSGTAGASDYFDITGVQIEKGSTATSFDYRPYGTELALCQRYYYRTTPASGSAFGFGWNANTTISVVAGSFPVPMRVKPSALEQSGTASHYKIAHGVVETTCSAVPTYDSTTSETIYGANFYVASGLTAGQGSGGRSNNASAYLGFSAEL